MAYSDFGPADIKKNFGLKIVEKLELFAETKEVSTPELLVEILQENIPLALAIHTEKARSELVVMPILVAVRKMLDRQISIFSGIEFNIDPEQGLNGVCDFLVSRSSEQLFVSAPVITMVEAKNDNIKSGLGQCISEMVAARLFNEREGNEIKTIYGVITTGSLWRFLKLEEQTVFIDVREYHVHEVGKILGILIQMVS